MAQAALTSFEKSLAAQAQGLAPARAAAFARFAATGAPHRRLEAWKWTDLRAALSAPFAASGADVIAPSVFANIGPYEITLMNGAAEFGKAPDGVQITRVGAPRLINHPMAALAEAFADNPLTIEIEGAVAQPILLRRIAGAGAAHTRVSIRLRAGAEALIVESFDGAGAFFANSYTDYEIGEGARLHRVVFQNAAPEGVVSAVASMRLGARAALDQIALAFGAKAARLETSLSLEGAGVEVSLKSAAALKAALHADFTSLVHHAAPSCTTRQLHKAALKEKSRGVFQGKFFVARGAAKTDARMNAGALLLSEAAEANAKPELEIYADDVACAHGSTAGALDENAVFYMGQRGLSEAAARALLIVAFLGEVFDHAPHAGLEHILRARLTRWLEGA